MPCLLIKNGTIVNAHATEKADVLCCKESGKILKIGPNLTCPTPDECEVVDATDRLLLPGGIDTHVHLDMPFMGTRSIDDFEHGTKAGLSGGTTMVCDFIIPSRGQNIIEAYEVWQAKAKDMALSDYTFHMALTYWDEQVAADIPKILNDYGINSFKMFMAYNGVLRMFDNEILKACKVIRKHGGIAQMHAENGDAVEVEQQRVFEDLSITGPEGHYLSRLEDVEAEATKRAIMLGHKTNCPMYIVHVMSKQACDAVIEAKKQGVVCYGEPIAASLGTDGGHQCHHNWRHAAAYVMSPPLRMDGSTPKYLMDMLSIGMLDLTGTDNCTFNANQKALGKDDFRKIPNGVNGIEDRMSVIWEKGVHAGRMSAERFVAVTSTTAARIFNMYPQKGVIAEGSDADIVVWNDKATRVISAKTHHHAVDFNIFEGLEVHGVPEVTVCRGNVAFTRSDDKFHVPKGYGKYVTRKPFAQYVYDKIFAKEKDYQYKGVDRPAYDGPVIQLD